MIEEKTLQDENFKPIREMFFVVSTMRTFLSVHKSGLQMHDFLKEDSDTTVNGRNFIARYHTKFSMKNGFKTKRKSQTKREIEWVPWSLSKSEMVRYLNTLIDVGVVRTNGSGKKRYYLLVENEDKSEKAVADLRFIVEIMKKCRKGLYRYEFYNKSPQKGLDEKTILQVYKEGHSKANGYKTNRDTIWTLDRTAMALYLPLLIDMNIVRSEGSTFHRKYYLSREDFGEPEVKKKLRLDIIPLIYADCIPKTKPEEPTPDNARLIKNEERDKIPDEKSLQQHWNQLLFEFAEIAQRENLELPDEVVIMKDFAGVESPDVSSRYIGDDYSFSTEEISNYLALYHTCFRCGSFWYDYLNELSSDKLSTDNLNYLKKRWSYDLALHLKSGYPDWIEKIRNAEKQFYERQDTKKTATGSKSVHELWYLNDYCARELFSWVLLRQRQCLPNPRKVSRFSPTPHPSQDVISSTRKQVFKYEGENLSTDLHDHPIENMFSRFIYAEIQYFLGVFEAKIIGIQKFADNEWNAKIEDITEQINKIRNDQLVQAGLDHIDIFKSHEDFIYEKLTELKSKNSSFYPFEIDAKALHEKVIEIALKYLPLFYTIANKYVDYELAMFEFISKIIELKRNLKHGVRFAGSCSLCNK